MTAKTGLTRFIKAFGESALTLLGVFIGMFLLGFLIMLLWNWVFPTVFGLPAITYWQGVALGLLSRLLFGFK